MKSHEIEKKINEMKCNTKELEEKLYYQRLAEEIEQDYPGIKVTAIGEFRETVENSPIIAKGYLNGKELILTRVYYTGLGEVGWEECKFVDLEEE